METKKVTIDLSLEKARKWFNSDNKELKDIAIQAYGNALETRYDNIFSNVMNDYNLNTQYAKMMKANNELLADMTLLATFYNGKDWRPSSAEECYFIYYNDSYHSFVAGVKHSAFYPNMFVPYFKTKNSCEMAIEILKDKLSKYLNDIDYFRNNDYDPAG